MCYSCFGVCAIAQWLGYRTRGREVAPSVPRVFCLLSKSTKLHHGLVTKPTVLHNVLPSFLFLWNLYFKEPSLLHSLSHRISPGASLRVHTSVVCSANYILISRAGYAVYRINCKLCRCNRRRAAIIGFASEEIRADMTWDVKIFSLCPTAWGSGGLDPTLARGHPTQCEWIRR